MGRPPCCDEAGVKKGPWTSDEDGKLIAYIQKHGHGSWRALAKQAGLKRCGKSCRLRWTNYLRPGIKRGNFSSQEEQTILTLHSILGNKWSSIAAHLPGRTDNEIKNYWNTRLKKRLLGMGIDPMTHRPRADLLASTLQQLVALTGLTADLIGSYRPWGDYALRAAQPEAAAQLQYLQDHLQSPPSSARTNPSGMSPVSVLGQPFTSVGTPPPPPVNCVTSQIHELPRWQELPPAYDGGIRSVTVSPFAGTLVRPGDDGGSSLIGCRDVYADWLAEYTDQFT